MRTQKRYPILMSSFLCATSLALVACGGSDSKEETIFVARTSIQRNLDGEMITSTEAFNLLSMKGIAVYQQACVDMFELGPEPEFGESTFTLALFAEIKASDRDLTGEAGFQVRHFNKYYIKQGTPFVPEAIFPCAERIPQG